ncbi:MAG TPA: hypothetical protein PKN85_07500 [Syntrophorhabdaceae bacterium]|nr:hypothetical protein [Syntrophorhabdaceae bacterium]
MVSKRPHVFPGVIFLVLFLFLSGAVVNADPLPAVDPGMKGKTVGAADDLPKVSAVKNPHGFLQFDGTGYRVVTKEVKPERTGHIRLKPVTQPGGSGKGSTVYTLEVLDDRTKEESKQESPASSDGARLAVERVEDLDKKGVAPEPRKEHKADVGLGVKVSESSEVMVGRALVLERKDDKGLESRDDGWRFRFKTNF